MTPKDGLPVSDCVCGTGAEWCPAHPLLEGSTVLGGTFAVQDKLEALVDESDPNTDLRGSDAP